MFYIKIYRQKNYDGNDNGNSYLGKQVYFEADDLERLSSNGTDFKTNIEYRNSAINHLNQSFAISSPLGRLFSYINSFLDKYVEIKS